MLNIYVPLLCAGETLEEQRKKMQTINITQPSTNVIVQPSKVSLLRFSLNDNKFLRAFKEEIVFRAANNLEVYFSLQTGPALRPVWILAGLVQYVYAPSSMIHTEVPLLLWWWQMLGAQAERMSLPSNMFAEAQGSKIVSIPQTTMLKCPTSQMKYACLQFGTKQGFGLWSFLVRNNDTAGELLYKSLVKMK